MPPRKKKGKVVSSRQPSVRVPQTASHRIRKTKKTIVVEDHIEEDENVELEEEHDEEIEVSNGQEENLQQVDNVELEEEHDEEIDVSNGQEENLHQVDENESDGEPKLEIYSGGPIDNKVLVDYEDHIARKIWARKVYEHFRLQNSPMINMDFKRDMPRMRRWMVYPSLSMAIVSSLIYLREEIDLLSAREVYWDPYKDVRDIRPLDDVTFFNGVLCVLDIAEGYNIDQVLRQVGYVQRIPGMPIQPKYGSKKTNVRYNVNHYTFSRLWTSGNNHVLSKFERGERVVASSDCVNRYIDWFNNISHPRMRNLKHFSQVHRLPPVNWELIVTEATRLLKESLDIGGTQDVHGMLAREKMIYNILQFQQIIQESSQSRGGGENSGDVGENSGGGQDNGGDGGENSGDNMDIDTTKLTKRQLAMR
ncbi:hypothetical protein IFM89_020090 [Coptis chinensis]|uniref:Aminotransferase-like plant mobile domain-containing protein n=1 Tax=Coptis chinensis TaxID=261450 RepID=A0A835LS83_9MAGN|nr:hypothetical protein IFM89_020090 [Coptis chinensis]